jgi:hypothetical protein
VFGEITATRFQIRGARSLFEDIDTFGNGRPRATGLAVRPPSTHDRGAALRRGSVSPGWRRGVHLEPGFPTACADKPTFPSLSRASGGLRTSNDFM